MADEDPIVQTLTLEGGETVFSDFEKMGEAGQKAFDQIYDAAGKANKQLDDISASSDKFGHAIREAASAASDFVTKISKITGGVGALVTGYVAATKAIIAHQAAQNNAGQSTKAMTQEVKAQEQALTDAKVAAVSNERAFSDLNDKMASGKLTSQEYLKASTELQIQQRHQAEDQARVSRIQQQATEDRIKEVEALQKQKQAQEEYNALVAKFGAPLTSALENIGRALNDVFEDFKRTFGPAAAELVNQISEAIRNNSDEIHGLFRDMASVIEHFTGDGGKRVQGMVSGIVGALRVTVTFVKEVVVPAFEAIFSILDKVASVVNGLFGTNFTGAGIAAVIVLGNVTGAFKALYEAGKLVVALGELLSRTPWGAAFTALVIVIGLVIEKFGGFDEVWKRLQDAWASTTDYLKQVGDEWYNWFKNSWVGQVIGDIKDVIYWFQQLGKAKDDTTSGQGLQVDPESLQGATPVQRLAGGGRVRGPGTETSDSIPAYLSNNEWVMRAAAVRKYGTGFMDMINSLRLDPSALTGMISSSMRALAPVSGVQRFSMGGAVAPHSGGRPLTLVIGSETFAGLTAPEHVADKMVKYAVQKSARSAGRRPNWVGVGQ